MCNFELIFSQNNRVKFGAKANANVVAVGQVGSGKTRGYVLPNIMEQENISMVISDPKGELYEKTEAILRGKGYKVKCINFDRPDRSDDFFNPFDYIFTPDDVISMSSILVSGAHGRSLDDRYWDDCAELLVGAVIAYLMENCKPSERTMANLRKLICALKVSENEDYRSPLEILFEDLREKNPKSFAVKQWDSFSVIKGSPRTISSIISVLLSKFSQCLTPDMEELMSRDTVAVEDLGYEKTALFVVVSDVDRSKDNLVSLFYHLLLNRLKNLADEEPDKGLPIHVHCFLDDFATCLNLPDFDSYISALRSREISFSLILQSEEQLEKIYGASAGTVISNCAHYLFFGSKDLKTCGQIARRMNLPLDKILYKRQDEVFVLSDFQRPIADKIYDVRTHKCYENLKNEARFEPKMEAEIR